MIFSLKGFELQPYIFFAAAQETFSFCPILRKVLGYFFFHSTGQIK